jgi:hypothetical protein
MMDRFEVDEGVQRLYRQNDAPFDQEAFRAELAERLAAKSSSARRRAPASRAGAAGARPRSGWAGQRRALSLACGAAVVLAALAFGIYAAVAHLGGGPVLVITDSTTTAGVTTTAIAATATTAAAATTERPPTTLPMTLAEQQQRYARAHERAQRDLTAVDFFGPPDPATDLAESELVLSGTVSKTDPPRWNTVDGQKPTDYTASSSAHSAQYATFYLRPDQVFKGEPRFEPVAIMVELLYGGDAGPLEVGDRVLVMLAPYDDRSPGVWKNDAYFLSDMDRSIYMLVGGEYVNIADPEVTTTLTQVESLAAADAAKGPAGIDDSLISTDRTVADVTGGIPQGTPLTEPAGNIPADLESRFEQASPGERLLYVAATNRDDELNAVLHTKNFHGPYADEGWKVDFDFFGAGPDRFGSTKYPQSAVGVFVDVLPIPNTMDVYFRLRDPLVGKDFYVRIPISGDESEHLEYYGTHLRVFNLGADEQVGGDQDPRLRDFLEDHLLSEYLRPGDIVRADFDAIKYDSTGKWEVHADSRGAQQVNALTVERLTGAEALLQLVTNIQDGESPTGTPSTEPPGQTPSQTHSQTETFPEVQVTSAKYPWGADPHLSGDRIVWHSNNGTYSKFADDDIFSWTPAEGVVRLPSSSLQDDIPDVSGNRVVWGGYDGKDTEIYTWTPAGGTVQITKNGYADVNPHVSGDRVVWCGMDQENRLDVFTWTPSTGVVQVTHGVYCGDARVSGDRLAWSASGEAGTDQNAGVFTWTPESGTVRISSQADSDGRVMVSGDRLAWSGRPISTSDSDGEIFTWTPDGGLVQVTDNNLQDEYPVVSGDRIAWSVSSAASLPEIYTWMPGSGIVRITKNTRLDGWPEISGDRVVWPGSDGKDFQIFSWTPATGILQVTNDSREHGSPAVSGDRLAWTGGSGGGEGQTPTPVDILTAVAAAGG